MATVDSATLARHLIGARNPDGGWSYHPGKSSRLESTAWAVLALSQHGGDNGVAQALTTWPAAEGLLLEHAGGMPNYSFHGLALLALAACDLEHASGNANLVAGLQRVKGLALDAPSGGRQDNRLQGWSWIADTFSWVEPTGWCLLSLKKRRQAGAPVDAARIVEAEKLLVNRVCVTGGWNYGNSDILGQDLRAYVPTTAIGILAMQDQRNLPAVQQSIDYLDHHGTSEPSATALALALIALRTCGRDAAAVRARLVEQLPVTLDLGNNAAIATALYALGTEQRYAALTL